MILDGKRVLITGGSSGIGYSTALALLAKGAAVVISGRRSDAISLAVNRLTATGGLAYGVAADVTSVEGREKTLKAAIGVLGGLDILINNAGGVRAGRLEATTEVEIEAMVAVDLVGPILLTRGAIPFLRESGQAMIVNVSSGIGLVGMPFYATYAAVKSGIAHFGEAMRRELLGEGIHVLSIYPAATDTAMMVSSKAGPDLGVVREPATAVADAIVLGIETDALEVIRGGEARRRLIALNRDNAKAVDERFAALKPALEAAIRDHSAL